MQSFENIFKRANIQSIRQHLMSDMDLVEADSRTYEERVLKQEDQMLDELRVKFPDDAEYDEVTDMILDYSNTSKEVFLEIGIQCGFILARQLLFNSIEIPDA